MGTRVDFLDETAHIASTKVSQHAIANRQLLTTVMARAGFQNYAKEWWHYTLVDEPFPDTYFNFPIK